MSRKSRAGLVIIMLTFMVLSLNFLTSEDVMTNIAGYISYAIGFYLYMIDDEEHK